MFPTIHSFGFFLFLGFLLSTFLVWKQARVAGLAEEKVLDIYFLTVFLSLLVGRAVFVYFHWTIFIVDYSRMLLFLKYPGFSLVTIIVTAMMVSGLLAKKYTLEVFHIWDILAFGASFLAVFGYLGHYFDVHKDFALVILATVLVGFLIFLKRKLVAKKMGLFFLCYLIFQLLSLLITRWSIVYFGALVLVILILAIRYKLLFKYVYDSISERRSHANQVLS